MSSREEFLQKKKIQNELANSMSLPDIKAIYSV